MKTFAITIGVNDSPRQSVLRFAESDESRLADVLVGPLGFIGHDSIVRLHGRRATAPRIRAAFVEAIRRQTDVLFVYFSGHGSTDGIAIGDGLLSYDMLAKFVEAVPARSKVVVLDTCRADSFSSRVKVGEALGGIPSPAFVRALELTIPGTLVVSASRAAQNSIEAPDRGGGVFTAGLVEALQVLDGDVANGTFISLDAAFAYARDLAVARSGGRQHPVIRGMTANFPMAYAQASKSFGNAEVSPTMSFGSVGVGLFRRRGIATHLRVDFENEHGVMFDQRIDTVWPDADAPGFWVGTKVDLAAMHRDSWSRTLWQLGDSAPVRVRVCVEDVRGRVLAARSWSVKVRSPWLRGPRVLQQRR